jgi:hypothetical protein
VECQPARRARLRALSIRPPLESLRARAESGRTARNPTAAWIERSGAKSDEPFLELERAEFARLTGDEASRADALRAAHRLFVEIGTTSRAEQIAREIMR